MEQEIKINDEVYYSIEKYNQEINSLKSQLEELKNKIEEDKKKLPNSQIKSLRFDEKYYIRLVNLMSKIFRIETESVNEDWAVNNEFGIVDPANICLVIPKTEEAKRLMSIFKPFDSEPKIPNFDWSPEGERKETAQKSKFSQEYIRKIFEILNVTDNSLDITIKYDFPGLFENRYFKFILAPMNAD